jgi:catalase-peroxidase
MSKDSTCPVTGAVDKPTASRGTSNQHWWPNQLNLKILHQNSPLINPMGEEFNYAEEFKKNRPGGPEEGPLCADDRLAGVVAG